MVQYYSSISIFNIFQFLYFNQNDNKRKGIPAYEHATRAGMIQEFTVPCYDILIFWYILAVKYILMVIFYYKEVTVI